MTQLALDTGVTSIPQHPIGERWESTAKITEGSILEVISEPQWRPYNDGQFEHNGDRGYWVWTLRGVNVMNEPYEIELSDRGIRKDARRTTRLLNRPSLPGA